MAIDIGGVANQTLHRTTNKAAQNTVVSLLTLNGTRKHFFAHEQWRSLGLRLGTGVAILLSLAVSASHGFV